MILLVATLSFMIFILPSMWNKKPTRCHLVLYLFLLSKLLFISCSTCFGPPCAHPQELTISGIFAACGVVPWLCRLSDLVGWLCVYWEVRSCVTYSPMDTQLANQIWLPTQPWHYTTREMIPLSRQLLMMGTRWPETCWATYKEQLIKGK